MYKSTFAKSNIMINKIFVSNPKSWRVSVFVPDDGKVVKAVSVIKDNWDTEEILLEELTVFQVINKDQHNNIN